MNSERLSNLVILKSFSWTAPGGRKRLFIPAFLGMKIYSFIVYGWDIDFLSERGYHKAKRTIEQRKA